MISDLLALNPWAQPWADDLKAAPDDAAFIAARSDAARGLIAAGPERLRKWAEAMLALKSLRGFSRLQSEWLALASLSVAGGSPLSPLDLVAVILPGPLRLSDISISGYGYLNALAAPSSLALERITALRDVEAQNLQARGGLSIRGAVFEGRVDFSAALFDGPVEIQGAVFKKDLWFRQAQFRGSLSLRDCVFHSDVGMHHSAVHGPATFQNCRFLDNLGVESARFDGALSIEGTHVAKKLWTTGARFASAADEAAVKRMTEPPAPGANPPAKKRPHLRLVSSRPTDPREERKKGA